MEGARGTIVQLRFAERLKDDGTIYTDNLGDARVTDVYTLNGEGTEIWEPRFTYHGFQYVELTGFPGTPILDNIEEKVVHDDLEVIDPWQQHCQFAQWRFFMRLVYGQRQTYCG